MKCKKEGDDNLWSIDEIGTTDWTEKEFKWFEKGPICEECIEDYFKR